MKYEEMFKASLDTIEERLCDELSIGDLAESAFFSKYHYQRLFHSIVGDSVMEYVKKRRLSLAGRELCETDTAILDIAIKYGYSSHEAFTRAFKAYHGVTPADCRRYSVFRFFEKRDVFNERRGVMKNISITDEVVKKSEENINEALKILNGFAKLAYETAEYTISKAKETKLPYANYEILSKEMSSMAKRVQSCCDSVSKFDNGSEVINLNNFFHIIKAVDDMSFQANLLRFNAGLQIARSQKRHELDLINEQYDKLTKYIEAGHKKINGLIAEIVQMVLLEIEKEIYGKAEKVMVSFDDIAGETVEVYKLVKETVIGANGNGTFAAIADEVQKIANNFTAAGNRLNSSIPEVKDSNFVGEISKWLGVTRELIKVIDDFAFKFNLFALEASIETARAGKSAEGLNAAAESLRSHAGKIQKFIKNFLDLINEAEELIKNYVSDRNPEQKAVKTVDDMAFMANVFAFYLNTEVAKYEKLLDEPGKEAFKELVDKAASIATDINELYFRLQETFNNAVLCEELEAFEERLNNLINDIITVAKKRGEHSAPFVFIANEMKSLARTKKFALKILE